MVDIPPHKTKSTVIEYMQAHSVLKYFHICVRHTYLSSQALTARLLSSGTSDGNTISAHLFNVESGWTEQ